jgi:hypothetical protein
VNIIKATQVEINWRPILPIYAYEAFLKAVSDEYGWIGGTDTSGKLRCVLPFTVIRKPAFRMVRFRVETIPVGQELQIDEERSFLNSAVDYFRLGGMDVIIPATTNAVFRCYPEGATAAPYGSYVIDLSQSEETLWNKLHAKHRNKVRGATKSGVEIRTGMNYLSAAYELISDTYERSKLPFMNYGAFERYVLSFGERVQIFVADYQRALQGCAVIPFSEYAAYYVFGGTASNPVAGAMNLLQWEAIRQFHDLGVRRYDFVGARINPEKGSKQEGLTNFKERFGGQLVQGYMWKYSLRPFKGAAYSVAVRVLRGGDIVDQERHKLMGI